jgi:hypothetical protein
MQGTPASPSTSAIIRRLSRNFTSLFAPTRQDEHMGTIIFLLRIRFLQVLDVIA